ncbi:iron-sulfur cluster repair di-iron protein [Oceanobacillus sp. FSL H7-0719]|uniref:iron-sulfur cluster repair di-iron protein n=1 Tax=Oceanobacillus sp. FSL H7-0719 TaxID=2954507 RepID=UPI0032560DD3
MHTFTAEHTPAEIVKVFPKASDFFKKRRIDFCCGGNRPLHTVCTEKDLNEATVLLELNTAYENWNEEYEMNDWDQAPLSDLVDYIIRKQHAYLKEELDSLEQFVTRVFHRHGGNHPHLEELHSLYHEFKEDMKEQMFKEANEVFPLIKEYEKSPNRELVDRIQQANSGLKNEHKTQGNTLKRIREVTNGFAPPSGACNTYRMTYARLQNLENDTFQHVHLKNNVLFKRVN